MPRRSLSFLAGALPALAAGALLLGGAAPAQAAARCPSTFQVLHNDRIGALVLPNGPYRLTVSNVPCAQASSLFAVFLADYDGNLPNGWRTTVRGTGRGVFHRPGQSIAIARVHGGGGGGGGGGNHPVTLTCRKPFVVDAPTQAGLLPLAAGDYRLTRLSAISPTCRRAAKLLNRFTGRHRRALGRGWTSLPDDGTFVRGSTTYGFRVEPRP